MENSWVKFLLFVIPGIAMLFTLVMLLIFREHYEHTNLMTCMQYKYEFL